MHKKDRSRIPPVTRISSAQSRSRVEWQLLSDGELTRAGATLINLILSVATAKGIGMKDIGKQALGVSPSYFSALRSGAKPMAGLGDEHIEKVAAFLGMPKVSVLLAAGRLKVEDFYSDPTTFEQFLVPALRHIQRDPEYGAFVPASIFKADPAIQKCVVLLYEQATGHTLIHGKVSKETIVKRHQILVDSSSPSDASSS